MTSIPPLQLAASLYPLGAVQEGSMGQSDNWAVYSMAQGGRAVSQKDSMNLSILKHVSCGMVMDDCPQMGL